MKVASVIIVILMCFVLEGCFPTQYAASTPVVQPEVNISTTDRGKIKSVIINYYMNIGYSIVTESDYSIVFSTKEEKFGNALYQAMTKSYNSTSRVNIRINMATIGNSTRVVAQASLIIKNDNGREDVTDLTNDWSTLLLEHLQKIKTDVETQ